MSKDKTPPEDELNIVDLSSDENPEVKAEPLKADLDIIKFLQVLQEAFPDGNLLDTVKAYKMAKDTGTMENILSQLGVVHLD